jgi:hypothetical protein
VSRTAAGLVEVFANSSELVHRLLAHRWCHPALSKRREEHSMRRIPTMMSCAGAAALTTLAVAVAVPAIGDDGGSPPTPDALAACLRAHGVDGAPDGAALKPWLGERVDGDASVRRALEACAPPQLVETKPGPSEQELRTCLKDHGVDVPGDDPAALKRWIVEHHDEAASNAALKACDVGMVTKSAGVACGKASPAGEAIPAVRADKTGAVEAPAANGAVAAGT